MAKLVFLLACATMVFAQQGVPQFSAITRLTSPGTQEIQGNITFTQLKDGKVHVEGIILGLSHGSYGFHIHEKGDLTGGCLTAGGHFNPDHKNHGHPNDEDRHVGDLGNVVFDENRIGRVDLVDSKIALAGPHCILGRAVVLHEKEDDYGKSNHPDSKKTGNAGGRLACGVIGILDPIYGWKANEAPSSSLVTAVLVPLSTLLLLLQ